MPFGIYFIRFIRELNPHPLPPPLPPFIHDVLRWPSARIACAQDIEDALARINIDDVPDPAADDQEMRDEIISIHSSASTMDREAIVAKIIELETAALRARRERTPTAAEIRNQAIHDKVLDATTGIATVITTMDSYTLWWVTQWVDWRKVRIAENGDPVNAAHFRSYKDWVRVIGARAAAGMGGGTVPQTPE